MSENKKRIRQQFRSSCFIRDNYTCMMCKKQSSLEKIMEEMDCHHIIDRSLMPFGGFVLENGITLCKDPCHLKAEEFHSTGVAHPGYAPEDLYALIDSSYQQAVEASQKLKS